jgi:hypothetical protein
VPDENPWLIAVLVIGGFFVLGVIPWTWLTSEISGIPILFIAGMVALFYLKHKEEKKVNHQAST